MRELSLSEFRDLPFGSNVLIRIFMCNGAYSEDYAAVVVFDKIYYKDGKVDNKRTIEEYMYNGLAEVYRI